MLPYGVRAEGALAEAKFHQCTTPKVRYLVWRMALSHCEESGTRQTPRRRDLGEKLKAASSNNPGNARRGFE